MTEDKEQFISDMMYYNEDLEYYEALEMWEVYVEGIREIEDALQ